MAKKKLLKSIKSVPSKKALAKVADKSTDSKEEQLVSKIITRVSVNARKRAAYHGASFTIIKEGVIVKKSSSGRITKLGKVAKRSRPANISKIIKIR